MLDYKIPPVLIAILFALSMWALSPGQSGHAVLRYIFTVLFFLAGATICILAVIAFKRAGTTVNPLKPDDASQLVCSGVFRKSRNPMYLGIALLMTSWALYLASIVAFLGVAGFVWYIDRFQIVPEENALIAKFGEKYTTYQRQVRRWI